MNIKIIPAREDEIEAIRDLIYSRCLWFVENDLIGWNKKYLDDFGVDYFLKQMKKNKKFPQGIKSLFPLSLLLREPSLQH